MSSPTNGERVYRVEMSAAIRQALRQLLHRAIREGRGKQFRDAARTVFDRLARSPNEFGEALYRLPALRLRVRSVIVRPLVVHFGVSENRRLVFIKDVNLLAED
jgi:hypothetical protein